MRGLSLLLAGALALVACDAKNCRQYAREKCEGLEEVAESFHESCYDGALAACNARKDVEKAVRGR